VAESVATIAIESVSSSSAPGCLSGLVDLLSDAVAADAAVGFLDPLSTGEAVAYWEQVFADIAANRRELIVARDGERIVGAIQIGFPTCTNANHRADAANLIVHTSARRHGLGSDLMVAAEEAALARRRHLLLIQTRAGDPACKLFEKLGYVRAGVIPGHARSPSGRLHGTATYYRDLRDSDALMLGESGSFLRKPR
jgi:acetyltransferase